MGTFAVGMDPAQSPGAIDARIRVRHKSRLAVMPGHQLQRIIARLLGQEAVLGCGCGSMIARMNAWGPAGCREHLDELTDRLVEVATVRQWNLELEPGVNPVAVGQPVPQTRRTRLARLVARATAALPGGEGLVRSQCRAMVTLAIRRAERAQSGACPPG